MRDSKSRGSNTVPVRTRPPVPTFEMLWGESILFRAFFILNFIAPPSVLSIMIGENSWNLKFLGLYKKSITPS